MKRRLLTVAIAVLVVACSAPLVQPTGWCAIKSGAGDVETVQFTW